jgi:methionine sulfoxide reductase catalytic subunit
MASRKAFAQTSCAQKLVAQPNALYRMIDKFTSYKDATTYNNFYEFATDKADPAR